jgi:hypothetical protein
MSDDIKTIAEDEWKVISINLLKGSETASVDIFIKINDIKFVKIYGENDKALGDILEKYGDKEVTCFYCRKEDYQIFSDHYLKSGDVTDSGRKLLLLKDLLDNFGVSKEVVDEVNNIADQNIELVKNDKSIAKFMMAMLNKGDYLTQHSMMVSTISCVLAKKMDWCSNKVLTSLSMAGILHDIMLTEDILLNLKENDNNLKKLAWKEIKTYKNHVKDVVTLLEKNKDIPQGVIDIIQDHHEFSIKGDFTPKKVASSITQVSALFILADHFCHEVHVKGGISINSFIENWGNFAQHFKKGNFRLPLACLEDLVFFNAENRKKKVS